MFWFFLLHLTTFSLTLSLGRISSSNFTWFFVRKFEKRTLLRSAEYFKWRSAISPFGKSLIASKQVKLFFKSRAEPNGSGGPDDVIVFSDFFLNLLRRLSILNWLVFQYLLPFPSPPLSLSQWDLGWFEKRKVYAREKVFKWTIT